MSARLVLPGDNPDVANLVMEHESGAISNLTASYASASEYYMLNIYGKAASAYYDLHNGLRHLKQGDDAAIPVPCDKTDVIAGELEEFAHAVRGDGTPEVGGARATASLAVIQAGVRSVAERRVVDVAEILDEGR